MPVEKKDPVTSETFEAWVRAIVADELDKRKDYLRGAVQEMLENQSREMSSALLPQRL